MASASGQEWTSENEPEPITRRDNVNPHKAARTGLMRPHRIAFRCNATHLLQAPKVIEAMVPQATALDPTLDAAQVTWR